MWLDLTTPLRSDTPVWPGNKSVIITTNGTEIRSTDVSFNVHTGTHIDAPWHFIENGGKIETIGLDRIIGRGQIIDVRGCRSISAKHCTEIKEQIVFFKSTDVVPIKFAPTYCFISKEAAVKIADMGVTAIGIDSPSVEDFFDKNFPTHMILLSKGIVLVEGLNLTCVEPGVYDIMIVPILLPDIEASPARVLARPV